jgi:hypothetical protein
MSLNQINITLTSFSSSSSSSIWSTVEEGDRATEGTSNGPFYIINSELKQANNKLNQYPYPDNHNRRIMEALNVQINVQDVCRRAVIGDYETYIIITLPHSYRPMQETSQRNY